MVNRRLAGPCAGGDADLHGLHSGARTQAGMGHLDLTVKEGLAELNRTCVIELSIQAAAPACDCRIHQCRAKRWWTP
jgi:hypothetical protein